MTDDRRTIFITGAASGMGRATARLFARNGWFVGLCDVNEEGLHTLASEIGTEALSIERAFVDSRAADTLPGHIGTGMMDEDYRRRLPNEGPWRLVPAEAVAEVVWASYHDTTRKLHWYVPADLEEYQRRITGSLEAERDERLQNFVAFVKQTLEGTVP